MVSGWRIAQQEYAQTVDQMLSGEGAYLYGGRWNSRGVRVVYLGSSLAQAAMELLVHLDRHEVLVTFNKLQVAFDTSWVSHIDIRDLPDNWAAPEMVSAVRQVGDDWVKRKSSLILQVPSAAVLGEYNFLLNPLHPDRRLLSVGSISPFGFDPRLQK